MSNLNADALLNMGFRDVGFWAVKDDLGRLRYEFDGISAKSNSSLFDVSNVLYAFVEGEDVKYIGKTTRSVRKRFIGYCTPSGRQITNVKNNRLIREAIANGSEVRIFIFTPISHLSYADFPINLAAGLEDSLVARFSPSWNGKVPGAGAVQTETAEMEDEVLAADKAEEDESLEAWHEFSITLSMTYYRDGMVNPGVEASRYLGQEGDPLAISFSDGTPDITSSINRTANRTGAVRFVGKNRLIADWFKANFNEGDTVRVRILSLNHVLMLAK